MSWPTIVKCYKEIVEDPTFLWIFLLEEYSSIQELLCLDALQFRLISEGLFACIASPDNWGKTGDGISHPNHSQKEWGNHQFGNPHHWWARRGGLWQGDGHPLIKPMWHIGNSGFSQVFQVNWCHLGIRSIWPTLYFILYKALPWAWTILWNQCVQGIPLDL